MQHATTSYTADELTKGASLKKNGGKFEFQASGS
jgi:hypothetical protein